jgi:hypothetical protein
MQPRLGAVGSPGLFSTGAVEFFGGSNKLVEGARHEPLGSPVNENQKPRRQIGWTLATIRLGGLVKKNVVRYVQGGS